MMLRDASFSALVESLTSDNAGSKRLGTSNLYNNGLSTVFKEELLNLIRAVGNLV